MCNRYGVDLTQTQVAAALRARPLLEQLDGVELEDVRPSLPTAVLTVADDGERQLERAAWGLQVEWEASGKLLINARAESLRDRRTFASLLERSRCALPVSWFVEIDRSGPRPVQRRFRVSTPDQPALAALLDPAAGRFVLVTVDANAVVGQVHERMPAVLSGSQLDAWVGTGEEPRQLLDLLRPLDEDLLELDPVPMPSASARQPPSAPTLF